MLDVLCRAITLEVFLPTILPCLPPLFACCLPCYDSVLYVYIQLPIVPNLVVINNHHCALTLSFMYNFPIGFLEGFSAYSLYSLVYTMSWSVIRRLYDNFLTIELCLNFFFHDNPNGDYST